MLTFEMPQKDALLSANQAEDKNQMTMS